jgi:RNAse (barnase) inhibitor barstar
MKKTFTIDGKNFSTLEGFYVEISSVLIPGASWGMNLDAFNDLLRGGFGTPEDGFILVWANSGLSRDKLGYPETVRQLSKRLNHCHPNNVPSVKDDLNNAERGEGPTVFDWLVSIIRIHGPGGEEEEDAVDLILR